ncbi:hypothetical protein ECEC1850_2955, partial [Escherichia coli EC1850]
PNL